MTKRVAETMDNELKNQANHMKIPQYNNDFDFIEKHGQFIEQVVVFII